MNFLQFVRPGDWSQFHLIFVGGVSCNDIEFIYWLDYFSCDVHWSQVGDQIKDSV
jgi:hypothetical protein